MITTMIGFLKNMIEGRESLTRSLAVIFAFILFLIIIVSMVIMIQNREIDHYVIGELIVLVLTLAGIKNLPKGKTVDQDTDEAADLLKPKQ